jgi:hypothetical protein
MRWGVTAFAVLFVAGCASPTLPTSQASPAVPTATVGGPPASGPCAGIPIIPAGNAPDTLELTRDPALEQKFPATIDGQQLNDLASAGLVESLCIIGGQASVEAAQRNVLVGTDLSAITVGSAQVVVDAGLAGLTAYRWAGHTGADLISLVGGLSSSVTGGPPKFGTGVEPGSSGGKQVMRWTNAADGSISYLYPTGDTLFIVEGITSSQADKIFAALP